MSFFERLEEAGKSEAQGGKIGKINLAFGYKIFISGMSNEDSFFEYDIDDDKDRQKALDAAKAAIVDNGGDPASKWPSKSLQITLFKKHVLVEDVTHWQGDQAYVYPTWVDDYTNKGGVFEKLRTAAGEAGIDENLMGNHFARIAWMPNLSEPQRMRSDEPDKVELVAYVAEFYASKGEAKQAAEALAEGKKDSDGADSSQGSGLTDVAWKANKADIIKQLEDDPISEVSSDWNINEKWLRNYCEEEDIKFDEE